MDCHGLSLDHHGLWLDYPWIILGLSRIIRISTILMMMLHHSDSHIPLLDYIGLYRCHSWKSACHTLSNCLSCKWKIAPIALCLVFSSSTWTYIKYIPTQPVHFYKQVCKCIYIYLYMHIYTYVRVHVHVYVYVIRVNIMHRYLIYASDICFNYPHWCPISLWSTQKHHVLEGNDHPQVEPKPQLLFLDCLTYKCHGHGHVNLMREGLYALFLPKSYIMPKFFTCTTLML